MIKNILVDLPLNQPMNEIFALIAKDEKGNEGIVSLNDKPIVFGQMENLQLIFESFSELAKKIGKSVQLCRYVKTEVIKEVK